MSTTLDYLVPFLRFKIGDTTSPYRYLDEWLVVSLNYALKLSYRYLKNKYVIDASEQVTRNTLLPSLFATVEADEGVIESIDEPILIILAAISTLNGSLENSAWDFSSWKDAEISVSSQETSRAREGTIRRLMDELDSLVGKPSRRLASARKGSLPGYLGNAYERDTKY